MCRKLNLLTAVVLVLAMAGVVPADTSTWKGTQSTSWYDPLNWTGGVPEPNDNVEIPYVSTNIPIIVDTVAEIDVNIGFGGGRQLKGPAYQSSSNMSMEIQSGTVYILGEWRIQDGGDGIGTVTISGGDVTIEGGRLIGCDDEGDYSIINFTGGQFTSTQSIGLADNGNGGGEIHISGDPNIECGGLNLETEDDDPNIVFTMTGGNLIINGSFSIGGDDESDPNKITADLDAGNIYCTGFDGNRPYHLDIHDVNFTIKGDFKDEIQHDIDVGRITGYDGTETPVVVFQEGYTLLGFGFVQKDASAPNPRSGTGNLCPPDVNLSWTAGVYATDHNMYFGTSMDDVNESASAYAEHIGAASSWTTPEIKVGTGYLWRVETINDACETSPWPGSIWSFGTRGPGATEPWPDNIRGLPPASVTELIWTESCFADTHKVYFGDDFRASFVLFEDDFSDGSFDPNWTKTGAWDVWYPNDSNYSPHDHNLAIVTGAGTLEMDVSVDASDACSMQVEFELRKTVEITDGKLKLFYWNGSSYDEVADLNSTPSGANDVWLHYSDDVNIHDPYLINGFKIKFESTISSGEVCIDDVKITNTWPAASKWYKDREDSNSYSISVEQRTMYGWRIDTVIDGNTYKGSWWTFSTRRSNPGVLLHHSFTGTPGNDLPDYPTAIPDNTGNFEFYKYVDPLGAGSVKYGESNPVYQPSGTSAAFDPCAGLYRRDPCAPEPEKPDLLRLDGYQYTIEMWIKPEALVEEKVDQYLIGKSGAGTWSIYINDPGDCDGCDNEIRWSRGGGDIEVEIEDWLDWDDPEWLHVAVVFDQSQSDDDRGKMFFYGEQVADSDSTAMNAADNNTPVAIGFRVPVDGNVADGSEYFQGLIDEIRILDIALDPGQFLTLTPGPEWASNPNPYNREIDINANDPNFLLSWTPGSKADTHKVYFGTDFDDVNTGAAGTFVGEYPYETNETSDVSLVFSRNYYWRVDEVNASPPGLWKGTTWKFTTIFVVEDPNQILRYRFDEDGGLTALDSSGYGQHGTVQLEEGMYFADWGPAEGKLVGCLKFDDDTAVDVPDEALDLITNKISISVWLYGVDRGIDPGDNWVLQAGDGDYYVGVQVPDDDGSVYFRAGNDTNDVLMWEAGAATVRAWEDNWHHLVFIKDEPADRMRIYFDGEQVWWKKDTNSSLVNILGEDFEFKVGAETDEDPGYEGWMDDLRVYNKALSDVNVAKLFRGGELDVAWAPSPYDGQPDAPYNTHLTWKPGDHVNDVNGHQVFFGTSAQKVANMTDPCATKDLGNEDYDPGLLKLDTYYYWRVDEVYDGNKWPGPVWKFKVAEYITVDDFEAYNYTNNKIEETWWGSTQQYNNGLPMTCSWLFLGEYPYDPVYSGGGGSQSMRYIYDMVGMLSGWADVCYAEAWLPFDPPQNWTVDVRLLRLYFYGDSDNDTNSTEQMYVGIEDTDGTYAEVRYGEYDPNNEDANDINEPEWHRWDIGLPHFNDTNYAAVANDINLAAVARFYIGFGNRRNPPAPGPSCGGYGFVMFDDIRLNMPICVPELGPDLDFSGNCIVDMADVGIMAGEWLRHDANYSPDQMQEPNDANLVGWWRLDGDACDSSIYDHNSAVEGTYAWVTGHNDVNLDDLALEFSSDGNSRVLVPDNNDTPELRPEHQVSVSAWVVYYGEQDDENGRVVVKGNDNHETFSLEINEDGSDALTFFIRDACDAKYDLDSENELQENEWVHIAGTYDGNDIICYVNGEVELTSADWDDERPNDPNLILSQNTGGLGIGNPSDSIDNPFIGVIDEVRVYNYGLSEAEVRWLATDGTGYVPLTSPYDLYDKEEPGKQAINYRDFAMLLEHWLEEKLYP